MRCPALAVRSVTKFGTSLRTAIYFSLSVIIVPFNWCPALGGGAITSDCLTEIGYFVVMVLYRLDVFQGFLVSVFGELEVHRMIGCYPNITPFTPGFVTRFRIFLRCRIVERFPLDAEDFSMFSSARGVHVEVVVNGVGFVPADGFYDLIIGCGGHFLCPFLIFLYDIVSKLFIYYSLFTYLSRLFSIFVLFFILWLMVK